MKEDDLEALEAEIEIIKSLDHPNIMKLHEVQEDEGHLYQVYENSCDEVRFQSTYDLILVTGPLEPRILSF